MAAAMVVPTLALIGLLATGVMTDFMGLMMLEHVVMFPSMLAVMLLRWDEYAMPHARHAEPASAGVADSGASDARSHRLRGLPPG
jgi:hypothetical protein